MKFLIAVIILISTAIESAKTECDIRGEVGIKQCLNNFLKFLKPNETTKIEDFIVDMEFICKIHSEKENCLGEYVKDCVNVETYSSVFGALKGFQYLFYDSFLQYACTHNYKPTEDDKKCEAEVKEACLKPSQQPTKDCESFQKRLQCSQVTLKEKCKNKEFVEFRYAAGRYALQKTLPNCIF